MKKMLIGLGVALALAGCQPKASTGTTAPTKAATTAPAAHTSAPAAVHTTAAPTHPAASPTWTTIASFSGNGDDNSDPFTLTSKPARLVYTVTGPDPSEVLVAMYVLKQGQSLEANGGIPTVNAETTGPGTTNLEVGKGTYYLSVTDANASWTAQIQQEG